MPRRITNRLLLATFAIVVFLIVGTLVRSNSQNLSQREKAFVGVWRNAAISGRSDENGIRFNANRTFRTMDGEFMGRWWLVDGQLSVKMWRVESTFFSSEAANSLVSPIVHLWESYSAEADTWNLTLSNDGNLAQLRVDGAPGTTLVRSR